MTSESPSNDYFCVNGPNVCHVLNEYWENLVGGSSSSDDPLSVRGNRFRTSSSVPRSFPDGMFLISIMLPY